jgi:succinyl-diaminopimelate desuccinylase
MNMTDKILDLSKDLIRLETIPERPEQLALALDLCTRNIKASQIEYFESKGTKSLLAYNTKTRPEKFSVILNGHLDVIPGKPHQYEPRVVGDRLYGVGATDMKCNVACIIAAFNKLAATVEYPLGLQLVTDEEVGGFNGTKFQIDQGVRTDFVIAAESTNFNIVNQAKGVLWAKVKSQGTTAHGAYPWRGVNAIKKMAAFLQQIDSHYPTPKEQAWLTTVNIASINSENKAFNKIPDSCEVNLDIRFLPSESGSVVNDLKKIVPSDMDLQIVAEEPALFVSEDNQHLKKLRQCAESVTGQDIIFYCAQGSSDARHFTRVGDAGVEFGPIGGGIGTDEEWINIPSLFKYVEILERFLI